MTSQTELLTKIDAITQDVSKPYFRDVLKRLARTTSENAHIIYEYVLTEITEINIKSSTNEGKIKILVWLSNYHKGKSFNEMTKNDILAYLKAPP